MKDARQVQDLRNQLAALREKKLKQAQNAASGLFTLIVLALLIVVGVTGWLYFLFFRGLIEPLKNMTHAAQGIRDGELSHRVRSSSGVSELRELGAAFNQMARRLESLDQAKSEFLSTVSHELKNPLAALKEGLAFLSSQGEELPPVARARGFSACLIASKRLEVMIHNLLKLSRGESGLYQFDFDEKDLVAAIKYACDEVRPMADKRQMTLNVHTPPSLRASFNWDGMVQVFENLLLNAIKYGDEGTPIEIHAEQAMRPLGAVGSESVPRIEVSVTNSGGTVARGDLGKLFERFYRGSNSDSKQGLGVGLHVVKQIVTAHHGGVLARSEEGKTHLKFWIPGSYETRLQSQGGSL